jgi:hypothetical protein
MLYRIAQRFGLPVVPEWARWFSEEVTRHGAIRPLVGVGCSPVLVSATKKLFLKWIGKALRQRRIGFPEGNGPVRWSLPYSFFPVGDTELDDGNRQEPSEENPATLPEQEGELCASY